jgi:hypothetical protein
MNGIFMCSSGNIRHTAGMVPHPGRALCIVAVLAAGAAWPLLAREPVTITFERAAVGSLPRPFRALSSSETEPGQWEVTRLGDVQVLTQTAVGRAGYRLAVLEAPPLENVRVGVRVRVADRGDRAAGLAWRVQDAQNYYAARIDFRQREFVLHKFVSGNRIRLSRLEHLRLDEAAWHEVVVEHAGDTIRAWLNGIPAGADRDKGSRAPGMVALWMPGDSSGHFARLWYEPLRKD